MYISIAVPKEKSVFPIFLPNRSAVTSIQRSINVLKEMEITTNSTMQFTSFLFIHKQFVLLSTETEIILVMTALAQRIAETPMAPFTALLRSLTREQKQVVVAFLTDTMDEPEVKSNEAIIREKYKNLKVSPKLKRLRGCINLTDEDLKDERTQYLLNR